MKKGLLFYCLVLSVIFHLALAAFVRLDQSGKKKEKEPIAIDLVGPLNPGPRTVLPRQAPEKTTSTARLAEKEPAAKMAPAPQVKPSLPSPASPAAPPPPPAIGEMLKNLARAAPAPSAPGDVREPQPARGGPIGAPPGAKSPSAPAAPSAASPGSQGVPESPRKSIMESTRDYLMAKVEREPEKTKDDTVTLDTDDLMYTAYLQGLKRRIELIWKYPETARRDGLQGSLVMRFTIEKSGRVERENIELVKSSGYPMLDDAAKQALIDASPFNPLPGNWKKDSFTITGTFVYRLYGMYLR
jgi:protein TonB